MQTAYELEDFCFQYQGNPVLDIRHCQIKQGINTAILGANGSGKTTLLNLLSFLEMPSSGLMQFFNNDVNQSNLKTHRLKIGYVQQKPYLFNLTAQENIELPLKIRGFDKQTRVDKSEQIIQQLSINKLAQQRAHELSGGEIQKVAIARALVMKPEVLILDEPFSHLDKSACQFLQSLILNIKDDNETTLIFSMHDHLKAHYLADEVFNIIDGHVMPSVMMNLFQGRVEQGRPVFNTGRIEIILPQQIETGEHLAVDPKQLVLSKSKLTSSMRNQYQGRVIAMHEHEDQVRVSVDADETFQAIITHAALRDLAIHMGDTVWVSFKSSSVTLF